ncbi:hypothetical protein ACKKBF_B14750 [Auxenochlorella protothecoides x Auxenochlorella symbiontica]
MLGCQPLKHSLVSHARPSGPLCSAPLRLGCSLGRGTAGVPTRQPCSRTQPLHARLREPRAPLPPLRALSPTPAASPPPTLDPEVEDARERLRRAALSCSRWGWLSFWVQLVLCTVAAVITLFSMAFTSQTGPGVSLLLSLFGIAMGYLSTFWAFGYTRLSRRMFRFLDTGSPRIRRYDVIGTLEKGAIINVLGLFATVLGLQSTIGMLVAKTLTTATVNPFMASSSGSWNPVLAFDVFNVQATTNAIFAHFFSLAATLWLLRIVAVGPSAAAAARAAEQASLETPSPA